MAQPKEFIGRVVILDDEEGMGRALTKLLALERLDAVAFREGAAALAHLESSGADVLLTDMRMPGMTGREVLAEVRSRGIDVDVIVMTAFGSIEQAIDCVKAGAWDYITKPLNHGDLIAALKRLIAERRRRDAESIVARRTTASASNGEDILGSSPRMDAVRTLIARVAPSDSPVLVLGESGTGKELVARRLHALSARSGGRFVAVNCAAIPEALMESELFGHEVGAFTGASQARVGLIEAADGGTFFLDEIGELAPGLQSKLLRVLQEREVVRLGSTRPIRVDSRIVAATNRDLGEEVAAGRFRSDLYYRLNVISIALPPLRERREDIPALANAFLAKQSARLRKPGLILAEDAIVLLQAMEFPGNVRELQNILERLAVLSDEGALSARHVRDVLKDAEFDKLMGAAQRARADAAVASGPYQEARDAFERDYLRALLRKHGGSVSEAAREAGISRRSFYEKLEKLGITPADEKLR